MAMRAARKRIAPLIERVFVIGARRDQASKVAAMANEPLRKKPRCILFRQCLVVAQPVRAGEELTVYYGNDYCRHGYSVHGNRHLHCFYRLDKRKLPGVRQVRAAVDRALLHAQSC